VLVKLHQPLSISSLLAELEDRVLLIDFDPQFATRKHLTKDDPNYDWDKTIRQVLLGEVEGLRVIDWTKN
jgi:cellulose biosynthesis protein BcsQ